MLERLDWSRGAASYRDHVEFRANGDRAFGRQTLANSGGAARSDAERRGDIGRDLDAISPIADRNA
jgi:hypothetical protein